MLVTFRKFPEGDIIALFPEKLEGYPYLTSYQHIGQHSDASEELLDELEAATPEEYKPLLEELKSLGYTKLTVVK